MREGAQGSESILAIAERCPYRGTVGKCALADPWVTASRHECTGYVRLCTWCAPNPDFSWG